MVKKIGNKGLTAHGPIQILYPGMSVSTEDSGIGSIGRIDHATIRGQQRIAMHPHVNDEILSYFRSGIALHTDSEGFKETIGAKRLMLMKAGKLFYHEENINGTSEVFEGLQIFIRPGERDITPEVSFLDLEQIDSENKWRLLASPSPESILQFSSQTWVYDIKISEGMVDSPEFPGENLTALLYVYQGSVEVNQKISLQKKECLLFKDEKISIQSSQHAELVLLVTDENSPVFKKGMYSGNQYKS